jgi:dihydropteroate synthase
MSHRLSKLLGTAAPWLMGVVNVTPDSFSDGEFYREPAAAIARARELSADGASIVDIGGESTAPGSRPLAWQEELSRIEGVVTSLAGEMVLSIDTYHARTAARCLELGAKIINDVSACRAEPTIVDPVREHGAVLVMMYAKDGPLPHATDNPVRYNDVVKEVGAWLAHRVDWALKRGLGVDQLVLDPGMGRFISTDPVDSWRLLAGFAALTERLAPVPLMIGTSRKGFLGPPLAERDPVSQLTATVAAYRGATIIRTHEVRMADQFLHAWSRMRLALPAATRFPG